MANEREMNKNYTIYENGSLGEVEIADEVVAIVAGIAATEVEGVAAMAGNISKDLISKLGKNVLSKGVRISVNGNRVSVDLAIIIDNGYNIPDVTSNVQEKVKNAIETMTGLLVTDVNIRIADVIVDNE